MARYRGLRRRNLRMRRRFLVGVIQTLSLVAIVCKENSAPFEALYLV